MSSSFVGSSGPSSGGGGGAGFPVGQVVGAISGIASALLAQHTARLRDATNENAALDALIPAFDADLQAVVNAYNSGTNSQDCINALLQIDSNAYQYLRAQVGKPGTAWGGPSTLAIGTKVNPSYSADCGKACTAGCCVYLNDLRPAIFGRQVGAAYTQFQTKPGIVGGLIEAISKGGGVVHVISIAPPPKTAYGNYQRAGYDLTVIKPSGLTLDAAVLQTSGSGPSFTVQAGNSNIAAGVGSSAPAGSSKLLTIFAIVGGAIVVITALFGQNALRVNR